MTRSDELRAEYARATTDEEREAVIEKYIKQGMSRGQIQRILSRRSRRRSPSQEVSEATRANEVERVSVVSKVSKRPTESFVRMLPTEVVPPEIAVREFRLQDGDYRNGFVDGIGLMLLAARYNQILAASQAEVVKGQLDIYERAKGSVADVASKAAREAAEEAVGGVTQWMMREKPWITSAPDPMQAMLVDLMRPALQNIINQFIPKPPGQSSQTPPGFVEE